MMHFHKKKVHVEAHMSIETTVWCIWASAYVSASTTRDLRLMPLPNAQHIDFCTLIGSY
jgi:hypothetical protein